MLRFLYNLKDKLIDAGVKILMSQNAKGGERKRR